MTIRFDYSAWPLIAVTQLGATSDAQFDGYLRDLEALKSRGSSFAMLLDLRAGEPFSFAQRARQNRWMAEHPEHMKRLLGIAFVESSWMMRGAMRAAFFALTPTYPYLITNDLEQGREWAQGRCHAYGSGATAV